MQFTGNDKTYLVTGGTRGIGRTMVLELARAGAQVVTCYRRDAEAAETLSRELKAIGGTHHVAQADVGQPDDIARLVDDVDARFGRLDGIVSNAGQITHTPVEDLSFEQWSEVIATNLTGPFLLVQHSLPLMKRGASIVLVGSRVAQAGLAGATAYTASKAGLAGLTRSLCKELGPRGIRVNVLAPGVIETEATADMAADKRHRYEQMAALRRLGSAEEVAHTALFLLSDLAGFITGETINVDGGV
jgi:3-oxoacyl-[acyl-carrier protein] reductase